MGVGIWAKNDWEANVGGKGLWYEVHSLVIVFFQKYLGKVLSQKIQDHLIFMLSDLVLTSYDYIAENGSF